MRPQLNQTNVIKFVEEFNNDIAFSQKLLISLDTDKYILKLIF